MSDYGTGLRTMLKLLEDNPVTPHQQTAESDAPEPFHYPVGPDGERWVMFGAHRGPLDACTNPMCVTGSDA